MIRVLIIGLGQHAKRIYFPSLLQLGDRVEIAGIIDLHSETEPIERFLDTNNTKPATLFLMNGGEHNENIKNATKFVNNLHIDAVIISTPPSSHCVYAGWALKHGYNIIMDKPIHAEPGAAHSQKAARKIHADYIKLLNQLTKAREKNPNIIFEVHAQRRSHPAYRKVKEILQEVYTKTSCPVTYYYAFHNDGQWRMPSELKDLDYHGFKDGTGKASHSGYHFYDLLNWFTDFYRKDLDIDGLRITAFPNFPDNIMRQVSPAVLKKVFGTEISSDFNFEGYGEIDICSTIQLLSKKNVITHAQIDLLHSGISARSWEKIEGRGLYKNNGRLRHEQHYIAMGPFVAVSLTAWQGQPFGVEEIESTEIFEPGHEFNLDIKIFRNSKLIGGQSVQTISLKNMYTPSFSDYSRGHQEDARRELIEGFFKAITLHTPTVSPLETHKLSSKVMSQVYESIASNMSVTARL